ncbi:DUF2812 domain-containing protein [Clostridium beijerinckii]|uniref:DUF2812 domain-containing protein n=1 Tax=Clostridium beijerinckii TaxID=1520 RepID=UPI002227A5AF|nr:DUF2812 domain-containing protein [Clostridium beijerinckii]UYZ36715.1 DUF2812 domain-containing protein [Clostridium beijerinckii]
MIFNDTKITFLIYSPYEYTAVEEYLKIMAKKGWLLTKIKGPFFRFKKIEPQKIKYSVDVIGKISYYDSKKYNELLEYREYCSAAGWDFICQASEIQVFCSKENTEIVSIHTDETEKFEQVFKSSLRGRLSELFITILLIFNVYSQTTYGTAYFLSSNFSIFIAFIGTLFISTNIIKLINLIVWSIRAKWKLKKYGFTPYNTYRVLRIKNILISILSLLAIFSTPLFLISDNLDKENSILPLFITVITFIIIIFLLKEFIKKNNYSRNARITINIACIFVFAFLLLSLTTGRILSNTNDDKNYSSTYSDLNLTIADFISNETIDKSPYIDYTRSILATRIDYSCGSKDKYLHYTLLQSNYPLVIKLVKQKWA